MADGESVEDQLDDLRTQWIELSDEIAPNISPIGEAPGLIRGKLVDLVEANDADLHRRPVSPACTAGSVRPAREGHHPESPTPDRDHLALSRTTAPSTATWAPGGCGCTG